MTTATAIQPVEPLALAATEYSARPKWLPVGPALCMIPAGLSWLAGGIPAVTDISWILMSLVCGFYLILELKAFPDRLGVGGLVLFAGVLGWFCWDYFLNWSSFGSGAYSLALRFGGGPDVLAKATFGHMLLITMATIGLLISWGGWLPRLIAKTPQPANPRVLLTIIVAMFLFSLLPYFLFTNVPWHQAIWESITTLRAPGRGTHGGIWTVGRTGRLNVAWGGYVATWLELGMFAAVLAAFYALYMTRYWPTQALCWLMWVYALNKGLTSGSRGEVLQVAAPALALLFIRYQAKLLEYSHWFRARPFKAYIVCVVLLLFFYGIMQLQAYNRYAGSGRLTEASLDLEQYLTPQGNAVFSTSLPIFELVPQSRDFFYNRFPGEAWLRPIPQTAFEFVIAPIPRALWHNKPTDKAIDWYNIQMGGAVHFGAKGATLAQGLAGSWWLRYGFAGLIEGGLLFGWLLFVIDRAILLSRHKPLILIISLALAAFMFRSFRDLRWFQLHDFIVGVAALWALSLFTKRLRPERPAPENV